MNIIKNSNQIDRFEPWQYHTYHDDTWNVGPMEKYMHFKSIESKINPISRRISKYYSNNKHFYFRNFNANQDRN